MTRTLLLIILLILISTILIGQYLGIAMHLYWFWWWYDILMHFLGGVFIGLGVLWMVFLSGYITQKIPTTARVIITAVMGTLLIGILWEIFERVAGIPVVDDYVTDTTIDLVMDLVGAVVASVLFLITKKAPPKQDLAG